MGLTWYDKSGNLFSELFAQMFICMLRLKVQNNEGNICIVTSEGERILRFNT